jgi:Cysteine-rich secretory protein family
LQPQSPEPRSVPREELVQHALDLINKDRQEFGLPPVELSQNQAAQAHAEDIFQTKQISHWMSNGEKPYMTYTKYDGEGSVHQNVAISGFEKSEYEECWNGVMYDCEEIEPLSTIEELQYQMMYNDKECCNDGHRNNILESRHTHVSIGIVYDKYYLALVQNFENNYGLDIDVSGDQAKVSGELAAGTLEQIAIYYDEMPTSEIYEQNKRLLSYSAGELVATVARPLPPGYYYEQQQDGHRLIVANRWNAQGDSVDVTFNLAEAVSRGDGVYTLFAVVKDGDQTFHTTSHSVFVDSS